MALVIPNDIQVNCILVEYLIISRQYVACAKNLWLAHLCQSNHIIYTPSPSRDSYFKSKEVSLSNCIIMTNTELEKSVEIRNSQIEQQQKPPLEIDQEIECPRCYATMSLCSDFDSLFYSCDECSFILYTIKKNYLP
jgi:hypothetical protein